MNIGAQTIGGSCSDEAARQREQLRREANCLHRALFGTDAPEAVRLQYEAALGALPLSPDGCDKLRQLADSGADLEAVEIALRRNEPRNFLTQRFQIICYLVEVRPRYFDCFVNRERYFLGGLLAIGGSALRAAYKLIKGRWQLRKHGLG